MTAKTRFTKRAATARKFKMGHWGQQTGPLKSDEQVRGGKKKHLTPVCDFSKIPAAKKNGDYKGVAATQLFFSWCKCLPRAPISHTHGHAKGFGQLQAVCGSGVFTADVQKCTPRAPQSRLQIKLINHTAWGGIISCLPWALSSAAVTHVGFRKLPA